MNLRFEFNLAEIVLNAERSAQGWTVRLPGGTQYEITVPSRLDDVLKFSATAVEGQETGGLSRSIAVPFSRSRQVIDISYRGQVYQITRLDDARARRPSPEGDNDLSGQVTAPTGGMVIDVFVEPGALVEAYQPIAVIEAMKVMTTVEAPCAGRVVQLGIERGQRVEPGALIAQVVPGSLAPGTATAASGEDSVNPQDLSLEGAGGGL